MNAFSRWAMAMLVSAGSLLAEHDRARAILEEHRIPHGPLPAKHETHASTITEAADGTLVAAWFAGTKENAPDVKIWASRKEPSAKAWAEPVMVDDGTRDGREYSTWNPVLFTDPKNGTIYLWYKITGEGPEHGPRNWWGAVKTSTDAGKTWSERIWLPRVDTAAHPEFAPYSGHAAGPIKNRPIILPDGGLLCGSSTETKPGWRVHFEVYQPGDWTGAKRGVKIIGPIEGNGIQPSFITLAPDWLKAFTRDDGITSSNDGGKTWSPIGPSPVKTSKGIPRRNHAERLAFSSVQRNVQPSPAGTRAIERRRAVGDDPARAPRGWKKGHGLSHDDPDARRPAAHRPHVWPRLHQSPRPRYGLPDD